MSTMQDFKELTENLGFDSDCPVCGYSWPGCQGACVQHTAPYDSSLPGPFHADYNDDCELCQKERSVEHDLPAPPRS